MFEHSALSRPRRSGEGTAVDDLLLYGAGLSPPLGNEPGHGTEGAQLTEWHIVGNVLFPILPNV